MPLVRRSISQYSYLPLQPVGLLSGVCSAPGKFGGVIPRAERLVSVLDLALQREEEAAFAAPNQKEQILVFTRFGDCFLIVGKRPHRAPIDFRDHIATL